MPKKHRLFLKVGIGASAGGLNVLKDFVSRLPKKTGMAFILVQHLDPDHESLLTELLAKVAPMPVKEVRNNETIKPDTIYVIPPNTYLEVEGNTLKTLTPKEIHGLRKAIDHLFESLADEFGNACAGVVLSGAGNDGTAGLRAIKAAGGLTMAQDPESAEHSSMPISAIGEGVIDKILPVEDMYGVLKQYSAHPYLNAGDNDDLLEGGRESLDEITGLLKDLENFDLRQYKPGTIQRRIVRRMSLTDVTDFQHYLNVLRENSDERKHLTKDLLINVTNFFRNARAFQELKEKAIDKILEELEEPKEFRIWIPGCATGEEAYTLGILVLDAFAAVQRKASLRIYATDVDESAIKIARKGIYPSSIASSIPKKLLSQYFTRTDRNHYKIKKVVRDHISFAVQNVTSDPPFSQMNLISCRNLLIYLKREVQQKVLNSFYFSLMPGGFLFLGTAETAGVQTNLYRTVSPKWRLYQKVNNQENKPGDPAVRRRQTQNKYTQPVFTRTEELTRAEHIRRDMLQNLVPPTIIIGAENNILYYHGDLRAYIEVPEGEPQNDLFRTILPFIRTRLRSAIYKTRKTREAVTFHFQRKADEDNPDLIRVETRLLENNQFEEENAVSVSFIESSLHIDAPETILTEQDDTHDTNQLEIELAETREELQNVIEELETSSEELKASNEEALSTNDELQSANEELEASAEELRSLNEELKALNEQLKDKIHELQQANNDVQNFFASTNIATIFLDAELKVQKFTPAAERLLGLGKKDLHHPIRTIRHELIDDQLVEEAREVLHQLKPVYEEKSTSDERYFIRQVTPYQTNDRRIEGVVIVYQDITEVRKLSFRAEARGRQQAVVAQLGILALSGVDMDTLMYQTVRQVAETLDAEYCKILRYQPDQHNLLLLAGTGWKKNMVGKATVPDRQDSQAGYTLMSNEPVIVKDLSRERRFSGPELLTRHKVVSGISCVINHSNPPFGVLGVHSTRHKEFTRDDANFMVSVANLLSIAIKDVDAQEKLAQSENQFRSMANSIPQLAWMTDETGSIFWYNDRWFDYTGTHYDEMKGWGWQKVHHPDHVERVTERFKMHLINGEEWEDTFPLRARDGNYRWFLSRARPIRNEEGTIVNWFGTNTDIHEQLETERALFESEQKLQIAKNTNKVGAFELSFTEENTIWDDILKSIWGMDKDQRPTQQIFWDGIHPDDRLHVQTAIEKSVIPDGDGHYEAEYRVINQRTGKISWVEASGQVLFEGVAPQKMIGMIIDITERKKLENSLYRAVSDLEAADRKKNQFLATLGHELRNPLASISGGVQLLQLDMEDSRELNIMANNVDLMSSLLDDLLDLTRIERGKIKLEKSPVDLNELVKKVTTGFHSIFAKKQQKFTVKTLREEVVVNADRTRLEQIISNLLSNATKFTARGGEIKVRLIVKKPRVMLEVEDNGAGIAPEMIHKIFDPFEQITPAKPGNKGLGIGLSLVKQFVKMHGGKIDAESKGLGQGTLFIMTLPLSDATVEISTGVRDDVDVELKRDLRILIVDDNEDAVRGLRALLERAHCEIEVSYTGLDALEKLRHFSPEVFILDIGLPDMDGYMLLREIRRIYLRPCFFIAHTGYGHDEAKSLSKDSGFDYHLNKPVKIEELLGILRAVSRILPD